MPDLAVLVEVPPTQGNQHVGTISPARGKAVYFDLDCIGDGQVTIVFGSGSMGIPCRAGRNLPTRNTLDISLPRSLVVRVEAPADVRWWLRIQQ